MKKNKIVEYTCAKCGHVGQMGTEPPGLGRRIEDKPYIITTPLQKAVCAWKVLTGYAKDDRAWDRAHWSRHAKAASSLIAFLGGHIPAIDCCQDIYEQMSVKELTCTIETIVKHSAEWKMRTSNSSQGSL